MYKMYLLYYTVTHMATRRRMRSYNNETFFSTKSLRAKWPHYNVPDQCPLPIIRSDVANPFLGLMCEHFVRLLMYLVR